MTDLLKMIKDPIKTSPEVLQEHLRSLIAEMITTQQIYKRQKDLLRDKRDDLSHQQEDSMTLAKRQRSTYLDPEYLNLVDDYLLHYKRFHQLQSLYYAQLRLVDMRRSLRRNS